MSFTLQELKITDIKISDRFRKDLGDIDELVESIQSKGVITPITVDKKLRLVAGERRWTAAKKAGLTTIPAVVREIEGKQDAREIELFENIHRKELTWDERANLEFEIFGLKKEKDPKWNKSKMGALLDISHTSVGRHIALAVALTVVPELAECKTEEEAWKKWHSIKEELALQELAKRIATETGLVDDAEDATEEQGKPKRIKKTKAQTQAIKYAKTHYVVGDALEKMRKVAEGICHFAEVDPPYGIKLKQKRGRVSDRHSLDAYNEISAVDYQTFITATATEVYRILYERAFCVWWFGPTWYAEVLKTLRAVGFKVSDIPAIWYKGQMGQSNSPETHLANSYEMFFVCRKGNPALRKRGRSNVFDFSPVSPRQKVHPTERPLELMEEILGTFTYPKSHILIPFLGSGVTLRAVYKQDLVGFGWDLSEHSRNLFLERVLEDTRETSDKQKEKEDKRPKGKRTRGQADVKSS